MGGARGLLWWLWLWVVGFCCGCGLWLWGLCVRIWLAAQSVPRPLPSLPRAACSVDLVLVGAEAVVENGGVINKLGTYQVGGWAGVGGGTWERPLERQPRAPASRRRPPPHAYARLPGGHRRQGACRARVCCGGELQVCQVCAWAGLSGRCSAACGCCLSLPPPLPPHLCTCVHGPLCPHRLYPLNQRDMPLERKQLDFGPLLPASVAIDNPSRDYTPPQVRLVQRHGAWLVQGAAARSAAVLRTPPPTLCRAQTSSAPSRCTPAVHHAAVHRSRGAHARGCVRRADPAVRVTAA